MPAQTASDRGCRTIDLPPRRVRPAGGPDFGFRQLETVLTDSPRLKVCRPGDQGRRRPGIPDPGGRSRASTAPRSTPSCPACWACGEPPGRPRVSSAYRGADEGRLFLENYLAGPVETSSRCDPARPVGAPRDRGGGQPRRAFTAAPPAAWSRPCRRCCCRQGRRWIVFTATDTVRAVLARLGAPLVELAAARAVQAPAGDHWGRYYARDPRVMAGLPARWPAASPQAPDGFAATCAGHDAGPQRSLSTTAPAA